MLGEIAGGGSSLSRHERLEDHHLRFLASLIGITKNEGRANILIAVATFLAWLPAAIIMGNSLYTHPAVVGGRELMPRSE